jgi:hypothetical protein
MWAPAFDQQQPWRRLPATCYWANPIHNTGHFIYTAIQTAANNHELPTCSYDHRFETENTLSRSDFFHVTMTVKRLGLNRHNIDLRLFSCNTFGSTTIAMQPA